MRHIIDCNERVVIGRFSTIAGYRSQILTHSIDIYNCRQHAEPIKIGDFCFIGTGCILLGGAVLPSYCVLGAGSVLTSRFTSENALYAGTPAVHKKTFDDNVAYFTRSVGSVI
jgi:acetyltransferase-like isoleucine patch superfamily enzyme